MSGGGGWGHICSELVLFTRLRATRHQAAITVTSHWKRLHIFLLVISFHCSHFCSITITAELRMILTICWVLMKSIQSARRFTLRERHNNHWSCGQALGFALVVRLCFFNRLPTLACVSTFDFLPLLSILVSLLQLLIVGFDFGLCLLGSHERYSSTVCGQESVVAARVVLAGRVTVWSRCLRNYEPYFGAAGVVAWGLSPNHAVIFTLTFRCDHRPSEELRLLLPF